jgi:hypothetical protein
MTWWLVIHAPDGRVYVHDTGSDQAVTDDVVNTVRVAAGFPADDEWISDGSGWDLKATPGEPHPKLMARATVLDLSAVDPAEVSDHGRRRQAGYRAARVAAAKAMLDSLDPDERAEALRP